MKILQKNPLKILKKALRNKGLAKILKLLTKVNKRSIISPRSTHSFFHPKKWRKRVSDLLNNSFIYAQWAKEKIMEKFMRNTFGRFAAIVALFAIFVLAGCSGGGGGGDSAPASNSGNGTTEPAPTPVEPAKISIGKTVPDKSGQFVPIDTKPSVEFNITGGEIHLAAVSFFCNNVPIYGKTSYVYDSIFSKSKGTMIYTPIVPLPYGKTCKISVTINAKPSGLTSLASTGEITFNTEPQPVNTCTLPQVPSQDGKSCITPDLVTLTSSPASGSTSVSSSALVSTGIVVTASGDLAKDSCSVSMKQGNAMGSDVAGVMTVNSSNTGLTFKTNADVGYAKQLFFTVSCLDTVGRTVLLVNNYTTASLSCTAPLVADSTGTSCVTPPVTCTAPQVLSSDGKSCVNPAPTAWWPPSFVPMNTKVYLNSSTAPAGAVVNATYPGQTQSGLLPTECKITGDACWQEAVRNGTIKFSSTQAVNTSQPSRAIVFGFYKTISTITSPGTMLYCQKPFFADDGTLVAPNDPVENTCNSWEEVYHTGNALGEILQQKNPTTGVTACYQIKYDSMLNGWTWGDTVCQ